MMGVTQRGVPDAVRGLYVWSAARWRKEGLTPAQLRTLARSGDLTRTRRGVYATREAIEFSRKDAMSEHAVAALSVLRVTSGAIVSHHSAAILHGLDMLDPPDSSIVTLTFAPGTKGDTGDGTDIVRYRAKLPRDQLTKVFGFYATNPARTVIDIARMSTFMQGVVVADSVLRLEKATDGQLRRVLDDCPRWPGMDVARRVVEFANPLAESVLESCARVVFHKHGLEPPELQVWIPGTSARVDFCWPGYKVIAEADGLGKYEDDAKRKIADQTRRDNALRRAGYVVIHFTWSELFGQPETLIGDLARALGTARRS